VWYEGMVIMPWNAFTEKDDAVPSRSASRLEIHRIRRSGHAEMHGCSERRNDTRIAVVIRMEAGLPTRVRQCGRFV